MSVEKSDKSARTKTGKRLVFLIAVWVILFVAQGSFALEEAGSLRAAVDGSGGLTVVGGLLDVLLLAGIVTCFLISLKVKSFLRDGELASGWNLFSFSFVLLFVAQLLSLLIGIRLLDISASIISTLRLLFVISLAWGIYFMKKVLS
jgi:hypothetical protein